MHLLLDTHALIWWLEGSPSQSSKAKGFIADENNIIFVSAASAMEIATKYRIGKLPEAEILARDFEKIISNQGFCELPISIRHARMAGELNISHKDPFDRFLISQAQAEDMHLVSNEAMFDHFSVKRLW